MGSPASLPPGAPRATATAPAGRRPAPAAPEVPRGQVDGADGAPRRLPTPREERLVEALTLERLLVHHQWLERGHQRLGGVPRAAARRAQERVALRALVGAQSEEPELALPAGAGGGGARGRRRGG